MQKRSMILTGAFAAAAALPHPALAQKRYEVWGITGGITVVHLLEGLMKDLGISVICVEETASVPDPKRLRTEPPNMLFKVRPESTLKFGVHQGQFHDRHMLGGRVLNEGRLVLLFKPREEGKDRQQPGEKLTLSDFVVEFRPPIADASLRNSDGERFVLCCSPTQRDPSFKLVGGMIAFMDSTRTPSYGGSAARIEPYSQTNFLAPDPVLWIGYLDLIIDAELAAKVNRPDLTDTVIGMVEVNGIAARTGREYVTPDIPRTYAPVRVSRAENERSEPSR